MKEKIRQIITAAVLISGIGELAVSQIHILATTKLFVRESGFYLFLFIIFGLTTGFNAVLLKNVRGAVVLIISGLLAVWSGIVYLRFLQADVADQARLTMADVNLSWTLVLISIVIYAIGIVLIPLLNWGRHDNAAVA